ncbi:putative peptidylprolyl isomerase [Helianthus annuus]|nr:putative peptidylprolyl isomerase [Helianthus annuus]
MNLRLFGVYYVSFFNLFYQKLHQLLFIFNIYLNCKHLGPRSLIVECEYKRMVVIDIIDGEGKEAREGDLVEVNYVCRRSNGYFVHSTVDQFSGESSPVILPLNEKEIIKGLKEVIIGMKAGGKRRALIPPSVGYVKENLGPIPDEFGPRRSLLSHVKEPLIFEVQLLKVL